MCTAPVKLRRPSDIARFGTRADANSVSSWQCVPVPEVRHRIVVYLCCSHRDEALVAANPADAALCPEWFTFQTRRLLRRPTWEPGYLEGASSLAEWNSTMSTLRRSARHVPMNVPGITAGKAPGLARSISTGALIAPHAVIRYQMRGSAK